MSNSKITDKLITNAGNEILLKVMEILEKDDGSTFEEKKKEAIALLEKYENTDLEERVIQVATEDEMGRCTKEKFWSFGKEISCADDILLRIPLPEDRKGFISIQKEYFPMRRSLMEESYCNMMWKEHMDSKSLMCTIVKNGQYVGYCGIKNTGRTDWEIAIELLSQWLHKGIGYVAVNAFLKEIKKRLGKHEFRVRIAPDNYASQRLFTKLGAIPNGISEFMVHDSESMKQCEEENLHLLDDKLIQLAEQFEVEPKRLLSHILEYRLRV